MTTTAADLLRGILEHPEDDARRLVYADFIEDQGRAEHAELIRVQCELAGFTCDWADAHGEPCDAYNQRVKHGHIMVWCKPCRRRPFLLKREGELLNLLGYDIVNTPRVWPVSMTLGGTERIRIRRGFVESWAMTARDWLHHADELLSAHPLREVRLTTIPVYGKDWDFVDSDMCIAYWKHRKPHKDYYADEQPQNLLIQEAMILAEWPQIKFTFPGEMVEEPPYEEAETP